MDNALVNSDVDELYHEISEVIIDAKRQIVSQANSALTMTYWHVGRLLQNKIEVRKEQGSVYGEEIVYALSRQLTRDFGKGFSRPNLFNSLRFYNLFNKLEKVYAVRRQLYWTHLRTLIYIEDELEREFYLNLCIHENWSTRTLREKIDSMLFQRTSLSKKPDDLIYKELNQLSEHGKMSADLALRDPYILDFLELPDMFSESDLESSILNELTQFLQEFGSDFCFIARQKRVPVGRKDYFLDLLFFHRGLRRLIAIELKLGTFKPENKGQMELYLKWLQKHEMRDGENPPLGIILCARKEQEEIELLELDKSQIHVAEYLIELPPKELLEAKLHQAIERAKQRLNRRQIEE